MAQHTSVRHFLKNNLAYIILVVSLFPLVIVSQLVKPWELNDDYWQTAATIREIATHPITPQNSLIKLPAFTNPRITPYTLFWGWFAYLSHLNIFAVMLLVAIGNYFLYISGLYLFIRQQLKSVQLPFYVFISMLFFWGTGFRWANAYHFEMFFVTLAYVGTFAFAVSFYALYFLAKYYQHGRNQDLLWYILLSVLVFIVHPITGAFCFTAAFSLAISYPPLYRAFLLQIVPLLALALSLLWPYFDYWQVFTNGTTEAWFQSILFSHRFLALRTILLGVFFLGFFTVSKQRMFIFVGAGLCAMIYTFSALMNIVIGGRFIIYFAFFIHLAIAIFIYEHVKFLRLRPNIYWWHKLAFLALISIFVVDGAYFRVREILPHLHRIQQQENGLHYNSPIDVFNELPHYLKHGDIVMAAPRNGWIIPALTGAKVVVPLKANPLLGDEYKQRYAALYRFIDPATTNQQRQKILQKYNATHVLLNLHNRDEQQMDTQQLFADVTREVFRNQHIVILQVLPTLLAP